MARNTSKQVVSKAYTYKIVGLRDFTAAVREISQEYPQAVKSANIDLAETLTGKAKRRGMAQGGTVAKGARSLKATRAQGYAAILGGSSGSPTDRAVFFGAEFGGKRRTFGKKLPGGGRGPRKQKYGFKPWRGNQWGGWAGGPGYFLFPTIRMDGPAALEDYLKALQKIEQRAFPD